MGGVQILQGFSPRGFLSEPVLGENCGRASEFLPLSGAPTN